MNNVDALKSLYTALGGSSDTVANAVTIVEVLNAISTQLGGTATATTNADAIAAIAAVAAAAITPKLQNKTITPTTSDQEVSPSSSYDGFNKVTVKGVTAAIDENIVAGNIKSGVTILGVEGTYTGE
jgi:hypothetical protein